MRACSARCGHCRSTICVLSNPPSLRYLQARQIPGAHAATCLTADCTAVITACDVANVAELTWNPLDWSVVGCWGCKGAAHEERGSGDVGAHLDEPEDVRLEVVLAGDL